MGAVITLFLAWFFLSGMWAKFLDWLIEKIDR